jgi:hypothetical protein
MSTYKSVFMKVLYQYLNQIRRKPVHIQELIDINAERNDLISIEDEIR